MIDYRQEAVHCPKPCTAQNRALQILFEEHIMTNETTQDSKEFAELLKLQDTVNFYVDLQLLHDIDFPTGMTGLDLVNENKGHFERMGRAALE